MRNNDEALVPLVTGSAAGRTVVEVMARVSDTILPAAGRGFNEAVSQLAVQLEQLRSVSQAQSETVAENTEAVMDNTVAQTSGKGKAAKAAGGIATRIFGNVAPVPATIVSLFRGESEPEPPPPLPVSTRPQPLHFEGVVARPASVRFEAALSGSEAVRIEGAPPRPGPWREIPGETAREAPGRPAAPVTVNVQVQAMDSRSFLDHSDEIARAVRAAMLHSHSLNDVVNEL